MKKIFDYLLSFFRKLLLTKKQKEDKLVKEIVEQIKKMEATRTPKQKRDWWLKLNGYSLTEHIKKEKKSTYLSSFKSQLLRYLKLKSEKAINIKSYKNRYGIPFYDLKTKTHGEIQQNT